MKTRQADTLEAIPEMMGYCDKHHQWEGVTSEGLLVVTESGFAQAFMAAVVLHSNDADEDRDVTDTELTNLAKGVMPLFYAEYWLRAPKSLGWRIVTEAEQRGLRSDDNQTEQV